MQLRNQAHDAECNYTVQKCLNSGESSSVTLAPRFSTKYGSTRESTHSYHRRGIIECRVEKETILHGLFIEMPEQQLVVYRKTYEEYALRE